MASKFVSVMDKVGHDLKVIGKDAVIAFGDVEKYLVPAATMATLIFPAEAAPIAAAVNVADLIQKGVVLTEQKYAALGAASGTGTQKAADLLTIVEPTVLQMLSDPSVKPLLDKEGITVNADYINNLTSAIVAILKVKPAPALQPAA